MNALRPLNKQSMEKLATDSLRAFILSGAVKPGARVTEIGLAEQMGIGRATARTGLQRLASEGIVVQIPYTGWEVASLSEEDVWELWTLRGSLEGLAAKLAVEKADPHIIQQIEAAFAELESACAGRDMQEISERDIDLHRTIVESVGHSRLSHQYTLVEQQVRLYIMTSNAFASDGPEDVLAQHRPVIEAIRAGDAAKAAHEAWAHNETEGRRLAAWLKTEYLKGTD